GHHLPRWAGRSRGNGHRCDARRAGGQLRPRHRPRHRARRAADAARWNGRPGRDGRCRVLEGVVAPMKVRITAAVLVLVALATGWAGYKWFQATHVAQAHAEALA